MAKHFVPHAGSFSTLVQKYKSSVKALIHNSPPSVHSTCCVIKAVLYPLLLLLVSISTTLPFLLLPCPIFFFSQNCCPSLSCSVALLLQMLSHTLSHTLSGHILLILFLLFYFHACSLCLSLSCALPRIKISLSPFSVCLSASHISSSLNYSSLRLTLGSAVLSMTLHFFAAHTSSSSSSSSILPGGQLAFFTTHGGSCFRVFSRSRAVASQAVMSLVCTTARAVMLGVQPVMVSSPSSGENLLQESLWYGV